MSCVLNKDMAIFPSRELVRSLGQMGVGKAYICMNEV